MFKARKKCSLICLSVLAFACTLFSVSCAQVPEATDSIILIGKEPLYMKVVMQRPNESLVRLSICSPDLIAAELEKVKTYGERYEALLAAKLLAAYSYYKSGFISEVSMLHKSSCIECANYDVDSLLNVVDKSVPKYRIRLLIMFGDNPLLKRGVRDLLILLSKQDSEDFGKLQSRAERVSWWKENHNYLYRQLVGTLPQWFVDAEAKRKRIPIHPEPRKPLSETEISKEETFYLEFERACDMPKAHFVVREQGSK